jgi:hypothetical protein
MKRQSPKEVFFLNLITLGIYEYFWLVDRKRSLCRLGADIPTGWLLIIPIANLVWQWEFAKAVEWYTQKDLSRLQTFFLLISPSIVRIAIFIFLEGTEDFFSSSLSLFLPLLVTASVAAMIQSALNTAITMAHQLLPIREVAQIVAE